MADRGLDFALHQSVDSCAREAIHHSAAIQPHGYLFGLDPHTLALRTKSSNLTAAHTQALAHLPDALRNTLRHLKHELTQQVELAGFGQVLLHCFPAGDTIFCEFENNSAADSSSDASLLLSRLEESSRLLAECTDLPSLCAQAAHIIRQFSGFERVLVYRFDAQENGEVLGESLTESWQQSLLGLHFPASDIPPQARALYQRSRDRWMPSCNYQAIPLEPALDEAGQPFDLSLSHYRSVSPIHRLYQRNIGTDGSMSISILHEGRLWGLIIGHHRRPHHVSATIKNAIRLLAQHFSCVLDTLQNRTTLQAIKQEERAHFKILSKLATADDILSALTRGSPNITDLFPGSLGAAMVWQDGDKSHIHSLGKTLPEPALSRLATWIRSTGQQDVYATDHLQGEQPWVTDIAPEVAGLLAGVFDDSHRPVLLIFRQEQIKTVVWAGKPKKLTGPDGQPNLPRRSFDRWQEIRRGHSAPWSPWELTIAADIINAINGVILRQSHRLADMQSAYQHALNLSLTDGLTGIANRRHFDDCLQQQLALAKRAGYPIGLLLVDIDYFKAFNDHYGHVAGDQCLIRVAQTLNGLIKRAPDLVARYGGEEIVLLLPGTKLEGVRQLGMRALQAIRQLAIPHAFSQTDSIITVSVGGLSLLPGPGTDTSTILRMVDDKLYTSKNQGRNRLSL